MKGLDKELEALLSSDDPEVRRQGVIALAGSGGAAVGPLIRAVADPDWRVRKTAVDAVVEIGGDEVFEGLYGLLFSEDNAGARNSAAEALTKLGPPAAAALGERIGERDDDVRKFIVDIIGAIGDPAGTAALIKALGDRDQNVRASAIEYLGRMKVREALDRLVEVLRTEEQWLAFTAAEALGELGDERAVGPLVEAAEDPYLREAALDALCRLGDARAWPVFLDALSDQAPIIRQTAVKGAAAVLARSRGDASLTDALSRKPRESILSGLVECLSAEDTALVNSALALIGALGDKSPVEAVAGCLLSVETQDAAMDALSAIARGGVEPLLFLLADQEAVVRAAAARILGEAGDVRVVNFIIPLLSDENGHTRGAAAEALGRLGDPKSAQHLVALLKDEYEDVQEEAIRALGMIKDPQVAVLMRDLAGDEDPHIRRNVAALIGFLDGPEASGLLTGLIKDEEPEVRRTAVESIGMAWNERSMKALLSAITDEEPQVRLAAVNVLADIGSDEAVERLTLLLGDVDPWVRAGAVRGLAASGDGEKVIRSLEPLLGDSYGPVRIAVIEALGGTGLPEALSIIRRSLSSKDPEIRKAASDTLVNFPGEDLKADIMVLMKDPDWSVRKAAVEAAGELMQPGFEEMLADAARSDGDESVRGSAARFIKG